MPNKKPQLSLAGVVNIRVHLLNTSFLGVRSRFPEVFPDAKQKTPTISSWGCKNQGAST